MSTADPGWQLAALSFLAFLLLLTTWAVVQTQRRAQLSLAACAPSLVVIWKHCVVRQFANETILPLFGVLVVVVLLADSATASKRWRAAPILGGAVVALMLPWLFAGSDGVRARTVGAALIGPLSLPGMGGVKAFDFRLPSHEREMVRPESYVALAPLVLAFA